MFVTQPINPVVLVGAPDSNPMSAVRPEPGSFADLFSSQLRSGAPSNARMKSALAMPIFSPFSDSVDSFGLPRLLVARCWSRC